MSRTTLYHVAPSGSEVGDHIPHRRYGFAARQYGTDSPAASAPHLGALMWEMALETARQALAPLAVSRLECLFACETETLACAFRDRFRPASAIYAVEPWHDASLHRGDYGLISNGVPGGPFLDFMPSIAVRYWTAPPGDEIEVLVGGPVNVLAIIDPGQR